MTTLTVLPLTMPATPPPAGSVRVVRPAEIPTIPVRPGGRRHRGGEPRPRPKPLSGPLSCDRSDPPDVHGSRLTPRGRAVVALVWLALAAVAVIPMVVRTTSDHIERPMVTTTVVVEPGDSLWALARQVDAAADPRAVISTIVELNGLRSGADIHPGDVLTVPAPG